MYVGSWQVCGQCGHRNAITRMPDYRFSSYSWYYRIFTTELACWLISSKVSMIRNSIKLRILWHDKPTESNDIVSRLTLNIFVFIAVLIAIFLFNFPATPFHFFNSTLFHLFIPSLLLLLLPLFCGVYLYLTPASFLSRFPWLWVLRGSLAISLPSCLRSSFDLSFGRWPFSLFALGNWLSFIWRTCRPMSKVDAPANELPMALPATKSTECSLVECFRRGFALLDWEEGGGMSLYPFSSSSFFVFVF